MKFPVPVKLAGPAAEAAMLEELHDRSATPGLGRDRDLPALGRGAGLVDRRHRETYVVLEARLEIVTLVPVTEVTSVPFWKMRYWMVQFGPAVEAFQLRVTLFDVTFEAVRPLGTVGITVQRRRLPSSSRCSSRADRSPHRRCGSRDSHPGSTSWPGS